MDPSVVLAPLGGAFGYLADRFATRWPEHDEEIPAGRGRDWRTVVVIAFGAAAFAALPGRLGGDGVALAVFGAWFATLVLGLAIDLDQRLLPDELTLPVVAIALAFDVLGRNPFVPQAELPLAVLAAIGIPLVLYLPSIPFGAGAFGIGDVKLLVGGGLMLGASRAVSGILFGLIVAGVVLLVLLAARRISRRSYVPFGPFLIGGIAWAVLVLR